MMVISVQVFTLVSIFTMMTRLGLFSFIYHFLKRNYFEQRAACRFSRQSLYSQLRWDYMVRMHGKNCVVAIFTRVWIKCWWWSSSSHPVKHTRFIYSHFVPFNSHLVDFSICCTFFHEGKSIFFISTEEKPKKKEKSVAVTSQSDWLTEAVNKEEK